MRADIELERRQVYVQTVTFIFVGYCNQFCINTFFFMHIYFFTVYYSSQFSWAFIYLEESLNPGNIKIFIFFRLSREILHKNNAAVNSRA